LQFSFWPVDPKNPELINEVAKPVVNGVVTVEFTARNAGEIQGTNGQIWIQVCDGCKFAEDPEGSTAPLGEPTTRRKRFDVIHKGVYFDPTTLKIIPPTGISSFTIAFKYTCDNCLPVDNGHPQKLRINITKPSSGPDVKKLIYTQEPASSRREDAPYAIKVVIQTDAILQPVSIAVKCNVDVVAGEYYLVGSGSLRDAGDGYVVNKPVYWLFFGDPPFRPESPVILLLMAKEPIQVMSVDYGPPR
jgi:hypothetical protein